MKKLTIFTPTYNRAHLLPKLYESLKEQTSKDFIWLIVDDGSKDETKSVVEKWIMEKRIKIDYHYKQNGGKNTTIDYANEVCKTEYICCVDSDDYLTKEAIKIILNKIKLIDKDPKIVGLASRRANENLDAFPGVWPADNTQLYFRDFKKKYNYSKDIVLVWKTNIIKNYHFPKIPDERFITEIVLYYQFYHDYKVLAISDLFYIGEYMEDGYTNNLMNVLYKNPKGYLACLIQEINYFKYKKGLKNKLTTTAYYFSWKFFFKMENPIKMKISIHNVLYLLIGFCLSWYPYIKTKKRYNDFLKSK